MLLTSQNNYDTILNVKSEKMLLTLTLTVQKSASHITEQLRYRSECEKCFSRNQNECEM